MHTEGATPAIDILAGVRVVDLTRVLAGPYCTQMLGDLGAEVIKVEPETGDMTRHWGPADAEGISPYYAGLNRNKQHASLNLASERGREILREMLSSADVLVENFRVDAMEEWGLGPETLTQEFPHLIYCKISGYGSTGPLRGYPGYDAVLQAFAGIMDMTGEPNSPPGKVPMPIVDITTGLFAFSGVLAALYARESTGTGQVVEASLLGSAVSLLHPAAANFFKSGKNPQRIGTAHPNIAPYQVLEGADAPIFVAVGTDRQFNVLLETLGAKEIASDPRFETNVLRLKNRAELTALLNAHTSTHTAEAVAARLQERGIPCSVVQQLSNVLEHVQVQDQRLVVEVDGHKGLALPLQFDGKRQALRSGPRRTGADTRATLEQVGLSTDVIDEAIADGSAFAAPNSTS